MIPWYVWVIGLLVILVLITFEGGYRQQRKILTKTRSRGQAAAVTESGESIERLRGHDTHPRDVMKCHVTGDARCERPQRGALFHWGPLHWITAHWHRHGIDIERRPAVGCQDERTTWRERKVYRCCYCGRLLRRDRNTYPALARLL